MKKRKIIVPTLALGMVVGGKLASGASDARSDANPSGATTLDPFTLQQVPASTDTKSQIPATQVQPADSKDKKSKKVR